MIRVARLGDLTFIRMARGIAGLPVYWTGAYLVDRVLVDCGPPVAAEELMQVLAGRPIEAVVVTHHHEDHMGGSARLHDAYGVRPQVHAAGVPLLGGGFVQELYRRVAWGRPALVAADPLPDVVRCGAVTLQVVQTPGHSPDHVCFFDPDRGRLFTGDLFISERLRFLREDEDLSLLVASLDTVCALPVREVFCAHRGPIADGPAALRRKRDHLAGIRDGARELLRAGVGEREIARRLVGREGFLTAFSRGRFSARNFVRAVAREQLTEATESRSHGETE